MKLSRAYASFYLDGWEAKLLRADIDEEELANRVLKGEGSIHEVTHKAVSEAARGLLYDRHKRNWLSDNEEYIKEAGGDADLAYQHYCEGRIDKLVEAIEPEVLEAMTEELGEDGGEDTEEEGEDGDDEDDEDDEDEDGDDA